MSFPATHPALDRALSARGYTTPTPVQLAVIEADQEADLLVSAQTGSGKTVAFGLALASSLLRDTDRFGPPQQPLALIIAPTRELAMQIAGEFEWLYAGTEARINVCVGGMSVRNEQQQLSRGSHIIIGTPGRLCDHMTRGFLDLTGVRAVVLDEADEMLDFGFREELELLLNATVAEKRRTLMFSATIPRGIVTLAKDYQRRAIRIDTTSASMPHGDIEHRAIRIASGDVQRGVVNVLRYFGAERALVFCATREAVRQMHAFLRERGFNAVGLSGEMGQRERNDALEALRSGHARVCVATDVAARGLDLPDLSLVIHADVPSNKATLLHRSGRTGRAGKKGISVLLATHAARRRTELILQSANIRAVWGDPPTVGEIEAQDRRRLMEHASLSAAVTGWELTLAQELAGRIPAEQLAGALVGFLIRDLPKPLEISRDSPVHPARNSEKKRGQGESSQGAAAHGRASRGFAQKGESSWFRIGTGHSRKADPKWILPFICRIGQITRAEVGAIRIFADETRFEIAADAADAFANATRSASEGETDDHMKIEPCPAPGPDELAGSSRSPRQDHGKAYAGPRPERHARREGHRSPPPRHAPAGRLARDARTEDGQSLSQIETSQNAYPPDSSNSRTGMERTGPGAHQGPDHPQSSTGAGVQKTPPLHAGPPDRQHRREVVHAAGKQLHPGKNTPPLAPAWSPGDKNRQFKKPGGQRGGRPTESAPAKDGANRKAQGMKRYSKADGKLREKGKPGDQSRRDRRSRP